jgi:predicted hydrocarbon binding protein
MHGVILYEFSRYVEAECGPEAWRAAVGEAGLGSPVFLPTQLYPDADLMAIVSAVCRRTGWETGPMLEAFGVYIVPALASLYAALIDANWTLFDMLERTEETMHRVVRIRSAGAAPPQLKVRRVTPHEVEISYTSDRRLCAFAWGIVRGLAKLYEEPVALSEPECMLKGAPACRIVVKARGKS